MAKNTPWIRAFKLSLLQSTQKKKQTLKRPWYLWNLKKHSHTNKSSLAICDKRILWLPGVHMTPAGVGFWSQALALQWRVWPLGNWTYWVMHFVKRVVFEDEEEFPISPFQWSHIAFFQSDEKPPVTFDSRYPTCISLFIAWFEIWWLFWGPQYLRTVGRPLSLPHALRKGKVHMFHAILALTMS